MKKFDKDFILPSAAYYPYGGVNQGEEEARNRAN